MSQNSAKLQQQELREYIYKFIKGSVILEQLVKEKSELWDFIEITTLEFILHNLDDEQAKQFLEILESGPPTSTYPIEYAESKIDNFDEKLRKEIERKVKGILDI